MENTLFYTGLSCIIASIVGGSLKAFGVEFPIINSIKRQILLAVLGVILIGNSKFDDIKQYILPKPEPKPIVRMDITSAEKFARSYAQCLLKMDTFNLKKYTTFPSFNFKGKNINDEVLLISNYVSFHKGFKTSPDDEFVITDNEDLAYAFLFNSVSQILSLDIDAPDSSTLWIKLMAKMLADSSHFKILKGDYFGILNLQNSEYLIPTAYFFRKSKDGFSTYAVSNIPPLSLDSLDEKIASMKHLIVEQLKLNEKGNYRIIAEPNNPVVIKCDESYFKWKYRIEDSLARHITNYEVKPFMYYVLPGSQGLFDELKRFKEYSVTSNQEGSFSIEWKSPSATEYESELFKTDSLLLVLKSSKTMNMMFYSKFVLSK